MTKCETVKIYTPGKIILNGLWYGEEKVKRVFIFIHGLGGSAFGHHELLLPLINKETGLLFFSNRGHDGVTRIKKIDRRKRKGFTGILGGEAHEVFTECADDLQGAVNSAKARGAAEIYLVGHSTGCQKAVYFLSRRGKQQQVTGAVLLAPMSDFAGAVKFNKDGQLEKATRSAKNMMAEGKGHEIMPGEIWSEGEDAQRFLSLYTPESKEEIFCYGQKDKKPATLKKIRIPVLAILAGEDKYRDRPIKQIANWFKKYLRKTNQKTELIENAEHGFEEYEKEVTEVIDEWCESLVK
jgi:pimeloyl-ACP methyl ester carboxylesterase